MFDSGINASEYIRMLKSEIDVAFELPDERYIMWLNALEQLLYSEFIREQNEITVIPPPRDIIPITGLAVPPYESTPRFEDIYAVYAENVRLMKSTLDSGLLFPDTYYKIDGNIGYNTTDYPSAVRIIYYVRPKLKTVDENGNIMLPYEHLELAGARLRGEAYKLVNEDESAAKWLADYNTLLENFKIWINSRTPDFGT